MNEVTYNILEFLSKKPEAKITANLIADNVAGTKPEIYVALHSLANGEYIERTGVRGGFLYNWKLGAILPPRSVITLRENKRHPERSPSVIKHVRPEDYKPPEHKPADGPKGSSPNIQADLGAGSMPKAPAPARKVELSDRTPFTGTVTGRLSSADPQESNKPKHESSPPTDFVPKSVVVSVTSVGEDSSTLKILEAIRAEMNFIKRRLQLLEEREKLVLGWAKEEQQPKGE